MSNKSKLPPISRPLMEAIERLYPDVMPDASTTIDELHRKQGEVSVVRFLRRQYDIQNITTLPGK